MGELKDLRASQESLLVRVKEVNSKLQLAAVGVFNKAEAESGKLLGKYAELGEKAYGADAADKARALLVARGLLDSAKQIDAAELADDAKDYLEDLVESAPETRRAVYEQCIEAGRKQRGDAADSSNEFVLAGLGAVASLRTKGQAVFDELVAAGAAKS